MNRHAHTSLQVRLRGLTSLSRFAFSSRILSINPNFEIARSRSILATIPLDGAIQDKVQSLSIAIGKLIGEKPAHSLPALKNAWTELQKQTFAYQELIGQTAIGNHDAEMMTSLEKLHARMHFLYLSLFDNIHKIGCRLHQNSHLDEPIQQIMEREVNDGIEFGLSAPSDTLPLLQVIYDSLVGAISIGAVPDARSAESMLRIAGLHSISDAFSLYSLLLQAGVPASRPLDSVLIYLSIKHQVPEVVLPLFLYRSLDKDHPSDDDIVYLLTGIQTLDDLDDVGDDGDSAGHLTNATGSALGNAPLWGEESPRNATLRSRAEVPLVTPYHFPKLYVGLRSRLSLLLSHLIGITREEIRDMRERWTEVKAVLQDAGIDMPTPAFLDSASATSAATSSFSIPQDLNATDAGATEGAVSAQDADMDTANQEREEEELAREMREQGFQEVAPGIWYLEEEEEEDTEKVEENGRKDGERFAGPRGSHGEDKEENNETSASNDSPSDLFRQSASSVHFSMHTDSHTPSQNKAEWEKELEMQEIDEPKAEIIDKLGKEASWWRERIRTLFQPSSTSVDKSDDAATGQMSKDGHPDTKGINASHSSVTTPASGPKDSIQVHELHQSLQQWLAESPYGTDGMPTSTSPSSSSKVLPSPTYNPDLYIPTAHSTPNTTSIAPIPSSSSPSSPSSSTALQLNTDMDWMLYSARYTLHSSRIQQLRYRELLTRLLSTLGFRIPDENKEDRFGVRGVDDLDARFRASPPYSSTLNATSVSTPELTARILDLLQGFSTLSFASSPIENHQSPEYRAMHSTLLSLCAKASIEQTNSLGAIPQTYTSKDPRLHRIRTRFHGNASLPLELDGAVTHNAHKKQKETISNVISILLQALPYLERNAFHPYVQLDDARAIDTSRQCEMDLRRHRHFQQVQQQQLTTSEAQVNDNVENSVSTSTLGDGALDLNHLVSLAKRRSRHHIFSDATRPATPLDAHSPVSNATTTVISNEMEQERAVLGDLAQTSEFPEIVRNEVEDMHPFLRKQISLALTSAILYR